MAGLANPSGPYSVSAGRNSPYSNHQDAIRQPRKIVPATAAYANPVNQARVFRLIVRQSPLPTSFRGGVPLIRKTRYPEKIRHR